MDETPKPAMIFSIPGDWEPSAWDGNLGDAALWTGNYNNAVWVVASYDGSLTVWIDGRRQEHDEGYKALQSLPQGTPGHVIDWHYGW